MINKKYLEKLKNKKILVLGFARSGYATSKILNKYGVDVILNTKEILEDSNNEVKILKDLGVKIVSGEHFINLLDGVDLIIKNPGIPYKIEILQEAIKRNIKIITEIELAYNLYNQEIIAITGTNGKTTTTFLVYNILKQEIKDVKLAGNIGFPAIEVMDNNKNNMPVVLEISSFQLNGTHNFKPQIAVITNLEEAHIDYHNTKEEYQKIKKKIYINQDKDDYLILNYEDLPKYNIKNIKSNLIIYSLSKEKNVDAYIENGYFVYKNKKIFEVNKLKLIGSHNLENCINAAIIAILKGISIENIQKVLYNFYGVEHRMQYLGEINFVKYYNDSKATNPISTKKALAGFEKNVILICGGKDRGINFLELEEEKDKIKYMICIGESKYILEKFAKKNNINSYLKTKVSDATILANQLATKGDVILLSPACASWDQYKNFEERGSEFVKMYNKLKNKSLSK